jgi:general secretion pathway protein G
MPIGSWVLQRAKNRGGFSLLEVMIVLTIIAILAAIAVPMYQSVILSAREAVLKDTLYTLRSLIDAYTADRKAAPQNLEDLVNAGYLREVPEDPMTESSATWVLEFGEAMIPGQITTGIVDVRSGSGATSVDGTLYSDW